ncbi:hypothetical protein FXB41_00060 [Bradyrhizobium canariense]|uniref:hypothetical protein n=1 Tax=Bradyrhizobium canariense TaxID=255045 RepID=UPI001CA55970|nr:hypothetical protein [Bradyrhizobium canariense]MBW5433231.1 hypothetical protein [Bradyrhizobium canariense]
MAAIINQAIGQMERREAIVHHNQGFFNRKWQLIIATRRTAGSVMRPSRANSVFKRSRERIGTPAR